MGTLGLMILPISAGSMSMWMILACGANSETLPVTRSEKRAPQAMMRSDSVTAMLAYLEPCMPTGPRLSGLEQGMDALPMRVVTTGICIRSASSTSSGQACDATMPPPAMMSGRSAWQMSSAACLTCLALPL